MCPKAATYLGMRRDGFDVDLRAYVGLVEAVEEVLKWWTAF